jgi:hypothetical protein
MIATRHKGLDHLARMVGRRQISVAEFVACQRYIGLRESRDNPAAAARLVEIDRRIDEALGPDYSRGLRDLASGASTGVTMLPAFRRLLAVLAAA